MHINDLKIKYCELEAHDFHSYQGGDCGITIAEFVADLISKKAKEVNEEHDPIELYKRVEKHIRESIEYFEAVIQEGDY